jgi:hypothetical protein
MRSPSHVIPIFTHARSIFPVEIAAIKDCRGPKGRDQGENAAYFPTCPTLTHLFSGGFPSLATGIYVVFVQTNTL